MNTTITKEELIKAAETLRKHCKEHEGRSCMGGKTGCLFYSVCENYFRTWYGIGDAMKDIAHEVEYSDG